MQVFLEGLPQVLQHKKLFHVVTDLLEKKERCWINGVVVSQNGEGKGVKVFIPDEAPPKVAQELQWKWVDLLWQENPEGGQWDEHEEQQKRKPPPGEKKMKSRQQCFRARW